MKSIFDGWTKKIEHFMGDNGGGYCALGWLNMRGGVTENDYHRIGKWIQDNINPPAEYQHAVTLRILHPQKETGHAIVWANNTCALDIAGFKMVDLLSQGYVPETVEVPAEEVVLV